MFESGLRQEAHGDGGATLARATKKKVLFLLLRSRGSRWCWCWCWFVCLFGSTLKECGQQFPVLHACYSEQSHRTKDEMRQ